jgi:DNA-binding NarL/FixJ family response regulator
MKTPTHILLAEDHPLVRQGIRALLTNVPGYDVIGETGDGAEVVDLVLQLDPDIVLLDISLPNCTGLEIVASLTEKRTRARVLMLTMHNEEEYVLKALEKGAAGYLLKSVTLEEMQLALRAVQMGYRYLSIELSDRAISTYSRGSTPTAKPPASEAGLPSKGRDSVEQLTNRQREVLRLMASGNGNAQIAHILDISPRTVELHRANVMHKLGLTSQSAMVRYALARGLISLDD